MNQLIRNIAILAHIDAGKTTLSESILFNSKEISSIGSIEDGLTTLDYLPDEKDRGITIETGISSFNWKKSRINILDTPGHIDFSIEVDCALAAVEGAVLVVSAVRGVETQTLVAWKKLQQNQIHPLLFLNKLDKPLARKDDVLLELEIALEIPVVLMAFPVFEDGKATCVVDVLNGVAIEYQGIENRILKKMKIPSSAMDEYFYWKKELLDKISEVDDEIFQHLVENQEVSVEMLHKAIERSVHKQNFLACWAGSAKLNLGVRQLMNGIVTAIPPFESQEDSEKVGRIIRMRYSRDFGSYYIFKAFQNIRKDQLKSQSSFYHIHSECLNESESVQAGEICGIVQTEKLKIGEYLRKDGSFSGGLDKKWEHSLLSARIEAKNLEEEEKLEKAFQILVESDPSIQLFRRPDDGSWQVKTVGEVQLEVLCSRLEKEFDCQFRKGEVNVIEVEEFKDVKLEFSEVGENTTERLEINMIVEKGNENNAQLMFEKDRSEISALNQVIQSALHEFAITGVCGRGKIHGIHLRVLIEKWTGNKTLALLKKTLLDALVKNIRREHIAVLEPWMDLEVFVDNEYCGIILEDLKARKAKIDGLDSDGKKSVIFSKIPLSKTKSYSNMLRSISKGTASYALRFYRNQEI